MSEQFELTPSQPGKPKSAKPRRRLVATEGWQIEDHLCGVCFGRVLRRVSAEGGAEFRCSNCGATGEGHARSICACAYRIGGRDAGIRCTVNLDRTAENAAEVIVKEIA